MKVIPLKLSGKESDLICVLSPYQMRFVKELTPEYSQLPAR